MLDDELKRRADELSKDLWNARRSMYLDDHKGYPSVARVLDRIKEFLHEISSSIDDQVKNESSTNAE